MFCWHQDQSAGCLETSSWQASSCPTERRIKLLSYREQKYTTNKNSGEGDSTSGVEAEETAVRNKGSIPAVTCLVGQRGNRWGPSKGKAPGKKESEAAVHISFTGKISVPLTAQFAIRPQFLLCLHHYALQHLILWWRVLHKSFRAQKKPLIHNFSFWKWYSWEAYQTFGCKSTAITIWQFIYSDSARRVEAKSNDFVYC